MMFHVILKLFSDDGELCKSSDGGEEDGSKTRGDGGREEMFYVNCPLWHFDTVTDGQTDTCTHSIHRFCVANITVASIVYENIV